VIYRISAQGILYALLRSGREKLYGVANVLGATPPSGLPAFMQNTELELMMHGLGTMDLDGQFSMDEELLTLIGACADCGAVLSCALRRNNTVRTATAYLLEGRTPILVQTGAHSYDLHTDADPAEVFCVLLDLPAAENGLSAQTVDSGLILDRDRAGLMAGGCSEEMADLILDACRGAAGYAQISPIVQDHQEDLLTLYYNENGILNVDVSYTWGQELFRLEPVTAPRVADRIRQMQKRG